MTCSTRPAAGKTTPGARLRDPRDGSVATVKAYDQATDNVILEDDRALPWPLWDRMEVVR